MIGLLLFLALFGPAQADPPPGYEAVWAGIPERHRQLVSALVVDRDSGGQSRRADRSIHLTPWRGPTSDRQLEHEVCHVIFYAHPEWEAEWGRRFWRDGRVLGSPPTRYASTSRDEDEAESCREYREPLHLDDPDRDAFIGELRIWP